MDLDEKVQRMADVKNIGEALIKNAQGISNVIVIYDYNDEVDSKGIYHSAAGNMMNHYGMVNFMVNVLHDFIVKGNVDYTNMKGEL